MKILPSQEVHFTLKLSNAKATSSSFPERKNQSLYQPVHAFLVAPTGLPTIEQVAQRDSLLMARFKAPLVEYFMTVEQPGQFLARVVKSFIAQRAFPTIFPFRKLYHK